MKKIFAIILALATLLSLGGCSDEGSEKSDKKEEKLKIVTTIFPAYDFARQIAKDKAEIIMLLPTGAESHSYEPTLEDIANLQTAGVFIYNGGDTDSFAEDMLENADKEKIEVVKFTDEIPLIHNHSEHESEFEHAHATKDEHVWTSPKNALKLSQKIADAIIEADPENKATYDANFLEYKKALEELDALFENTVKNGSLDCIAFADRFPFLYLSEDYGLRHFEALDGCSSDTEPTLTALNQLQKNIDNEGIKTVFYLEFSSGTVADKICKLTGAEKLLFHSCHNVSKEELEEGETYLSLMKKNAERLKIALK